MGAGNERADGGQRGLHGRAYTTEFDRRFAGKLRGAWVLVGPSQPLVNPDAPMTRADSVRLDSLRAIASGAQRR